jgi:phosphoribosyl 1,2-cyclic phosphodiesterase
VPHREDPLKIRFWGTRGSIPTPGPRTVRYGGNTACVEVRDSTGALLVLDAGTGLRELGIAMMNGGNEGPFDVELLLSHLHWDHIQGIPFFRPAYDSRSRLRIIGPKQSRALRDLLGMGLDDPFFPVEIGELPVHLDIGEMADGSDERVGRFRVRSSTIFHSAPALAYRVEADGRSLVYATDTEDAFSGRPNPVIALSADANTLIHDSQFLPSDFKATWGHSTVDAAVDVAVRARVARLVLFHHDPDRSDDALDRIGRDAQRAASERRPGLEVVVAREGLELTV